MPRLSAALVVDSDPKGLEVLAYGLQGEGVRVTSSSDHAAGVELAVSAAPQIAVVVAREPVADALSLARTLRAPSSGPPIPVLMLGPATLRPEARAIPGVDFLPLPAFVRDVITAGKMLAAADSDGQNADIGGALSEYGLFFLLRTILGLGRSAHVQLERGNRRGEIRFLEGQVTAAQVGSLQGSAALHHLLLWEEAALDLKLRPVIHRGPFHQRSEDLLEEAERFLRDFAHATKNLGPIRTVLTVDPGSAGQTVPPEVVPVVRMFDGQRTLGDVIEDSPFRVFDTIRIISRLVDTAVLIRQQQPPGPVAASPAQLDPEPAPVVPSIEESAAGAPPIGLPARPGAPKEQRAGAAKAGRPGRRDKPTPDHASLPKTSPPKTTSPTSATPDAAKHTGAKSGAATPAARAAPPARGAVLADTGASARGEMRSSGTIEVRHSATRDTPAGGTSDPSVVIDFEAIGAPATAPAPPPAAVVSATIPAPGHLAQAVGVVEGRPLRNDRAAPPAPPGGSIQLDPELMAEMVAIEMASTPATPPPTVSAPPVPPEGEQRMVSLVATPNGHTAPPAVLVGGLPPRQPAPPESATPRPTGEPGAAGESRSPAAAPPAGAAPPGSKTEPSATAPPGAGPASPGPASATAVSSAAGVTPPPAGTAPSATTADKPQAPSAEAATAQTSSVVAGSAPPAAPASAHAAPAAGAPVPQAIAASGSQPTIPGGPRNPQRRPSSEFDALERDFFAREADLYKEETGEVHEDDGRKTST
jgi:CheY-like chemotaxis protein